MLWGFATRLAFKLSETKRVFALGGERKLNECLRGVMSEFSFESWANTELALLSFKRSKQTNFTCLNLRI